MSILKNMLGTFMPHFESRRTVGTLTALNSEIVHDVNGDESAVISLSGIGTFNATYVVEGTAKSTTYFPLLCHPYYSLAGTIPPAGQPLYTEVLNAATPIRTLCANVAGLQKIRIRISAYTAGTADISINSDSCSSISPYVKDQKVATLMVTATAAVSTAVTATLPAVPGLRHYIDGITVVRSATAALTASATPVLVTTTNIPGAPILTFGSDVGGIGVDKQLALDFGGAGISATSIGTATTIICPAYTGVIWRINVMYRLGL